MISNKLFSIVFLSVIYSSWIPFRGGIPVGEPQKIFPSEVTVSKVLDGDFQNSLESYWNQNFGLRNTLVRMKNTIYSLININTFNYSYFRQIVMGDGDYLFQKNFITPKFCKDRCVSIVETNLDIINKLTSRLKSYGIPVFVILLPDKASQLSDLWPTIWKEQLKHNANYTNWHKVIENQLIKNKIPVLNLNEKYLYEVQGDKNFRRYAFLKTGEHWTLFGADYAIPYITQFLETNLGVDIPEIGHKQLKFSGYPLHSETDLRDLLNVSYFPLKKEVNEYPFWDYSINSSGFGQKIVLYGDSYTNQLVKSLIASGIFQYDEIAHFENRLIDSKSFFKKFEPGVPLILAYTLPNLTTSRVKNDIDVLLEHMSIGVNYSDGWYKQGNGEYLLSDVAEMSFLSEGKDVSLSFTITGKLKTVSSCEIYLNDKNVYSVNYDGDFVKKDIFIRSDTRQGVNNVRIVTKGTAQPMYLSIPDWRKVGVTITEPVIKWVNE